MSGNRVEDLEAKVRELEATINGLTDELVETKERLETIEGETGIEPDSLDERFGQTRSQEPTTEHDKGAAAGAVNDEKAADGTDNEDGDGEETADSAGDDIIVA
jgi:uncharacterized coiled-coil protein SlyX